MQPRILLLQIIVLFVVISATTARTRKSKHLKVHDEMNRIGDRNWNLPKYEKFRRYRERGEFTSGLKRRRLSKRNSQVATKRTDYSKSWSGGYGVYNNAPPYLVYNKKTGSYYPYFYYPKGNGVRRQADKVRRQK